MNVYRGALSRIARNKINWLFIVLFPMIIVIGMLATGSVNSMDPDLTIGSVRVGITDLDETILSQTLVKQLQTRYTCSKVGEGDVTVLTEQTVDYVLTIPAGYQAGLLSGHVPELRGASLKLSDAQFLAGSTAETVTHSLLLLASGADEGDLPGLTETWSGQSYVTVSADESPRGWGSVASWLGFYGWVAMLTGFFLVKTVMQDRFNGLPERVGVLPISRRRYLLQCILAVFTVGEVSALALIAGTHAATGIALEYFAQLFLLLTMYNLFSVGLALGLYSLFKSEGNIALAVILISTLMSMLGGSYWPVDFMPEFMQRAAFFSPTYWFIKALWSVDKITAENYWLPLLFLLIFSIVVFLLGSWRKVQKAED